MGVKEILSRDPQHRPAKLSRSPAPLVHAATQAARKEFYGMYSWFVATFQDAAKLLRLGDRTACFPAGSFPPALPFSRASRLRLFESHTARTEGDSSGPASLWGEVCPNEAGASAIEKKS